MGEWTCIYYIYIINTSNLTSICGSLKLNIKRYATELFEKNIRFVKHAYFTFWFKYVYHTFILRKHKTLATNWYIQWQYLDYRDNIYQKLVIKPMIDVAKSDQIYI